MRRLSRLDRSIDVLRHRAAASLSSPFLCSSCHQHSPFSTALRRSASSGWTEKLRKKIWKDQPPGLEDPYDSSSPPIQRTAVSQREINISKSTLPPVDMSTYIPATTWDGLVEVGEDPVEEFHFVGFMPEDLVTDPLEATAALHRAVVEVFTIKNIGNALSEISNGSRTVDLTSTVQVSLPDQGSSPVLDYSLSAPEETILQSFRNGGRNNEVTEILDDSAYMEESEAKEAIDPAIEDIQPAQERSTERTTEGFQPSQLRRQVASWDPVWLKISLEDPEIKFAIVKRTMQLTGIRIPDSALRSISTVRALLHHIITPPKPKKLAEALVQKNELVSLPNVRIFDRRVTPIDKEISVGRWKVIEKELERRGLPITGH